MSVGQHEEDQQLSEDNKNSGTQLGKECHESWQYHRAPEVTCSHISYCGGSFSQRYLAEGPGKYGSRYRKWITSMWFAASMGCGF